MTRKLMQIYTKQSEGEETTDDQVRRCQMTMQDTGSLCT
jgi:hypothetical protein